MNKQILIFIPVTIAIAGGSFFGGLVLGYFKAGQGNFSRTGQGSTIRKNIGMGGNLIVGQILSLEGNTLTVKLQTGGSKIVLLSDITKVLKSTDTTKEELLTDKNITVTGKTNSDGTVTADTIQIRSDVPTNDIKPEQPNK